MTATVPAVVHLDGTPTPETVEALTGVSVKGRTTEDVLREIAREGGADPRILALVARFDSRAARRAERES
jgi:hypothetical protein